MFVTVVVVTEGKVIGAMVPEPYNISFHTLALATYKYSLLSVVQKTIKPFAGFAIADIWLWVIRGINNPLEVDLTSSIAELSGALLSMLMPTCAEI